MPPRRSTRASLPTPANSTRSGHTMSATSTPGTNDFKPVDLPNGLYTPKSLSDEDEVAEELELKEEEVKPRRNTKRKSEVVTPSASESVFSDDSATSSKASRRPYELSVELPSHKRSKLATEKTTSADNLTLGSPVDKKADRSSSVLMKDEPMSEIEEEQATKPTGRVAKAGKFAAHKASKENQPFNIGTYSTVKKETAAHLALDKDDLRDIAKLDEPPQPKPTRGRASKGKAKYIQSSEDELTLKDDPTEDESFALDSDEEDAQLQKAIKASTKATATRSGKGRARASTSSAGTSSAASSTGKAKGKKAVKKGNLLRTAAAKAAERRMAMAKGNASGSSGSESEYEPDTKSTTDLPDEDSESALSDLSDEDSDFSEASTPKRGKGAKAKPKANAKGKGKAKGGFAGRGKRVDGEAVAARLRKGSDTAHVGYVERHPGEDSDDYDNRCYDKFNNDKYAVELEGFKKEERKKKKEVGRKLTNGEKNHIRLVKYHPELTDVWGDIADKITPIKPVPMEAHPSLKLSLLPFQKESLHWMKKQEEGPWKGGMLADEMGMGKTIQTIALLLSEPRRKPSLVVAPVVALMQWKHEIETHAEGFTVCLWHGQGRMKASELKKYDVVLSSYGTLEAAFRRQQRGFKKGNVFIKEPSPVHSFQWHRVVLDEAHNIKERSTNAAKAAFSLDSQYKWCLSGTPLQNRVGELYSLVRFLGADPFSHYFCKRCDCKSLHWQFGNNRECDQCGHTPMQHLCFWNSEILNPIARYGIEQGNPGHTAFKKLKILLDRMMLRRTKLERADDLGLPPRTIVVRRDFFSPEEKELYMSLFTGARRQFSTYVGAGTVLNNYSNIFSLITRMRQMACHPDLVLRGKTSKLLPQAEEGTVCRLCNDEAEDAIMSGCKHVFDRECIRQYLEVQQLRGHRPECPVCHIEISIDLEAEAIDLTDGGASKKARQGILSRLDLSKWRSSTKLEALVEELEKLRRNDCTTKSLVFSQFVSFLDLIAFRLQRAGFNICRLEGGMTPQQRDATIQHFMNNPGVTVFLISLKAGGVALNLTEASMVFMMDSWWNPSVEYQAMDRIHRLGQKRPVKVVKLVVEDSIEDQIVQLQHKKLAMTEAALSTDPDAALGKLTVEDLGFLFKM